MDAMMFDQHLRSPLRLFSDHHSMMQHLVGHHYQPGDVNDATSAMLLEKARQHLQIWGRSPYTDLLLPHMYHHHHQQQQHSTSGAGAPSSPSAASSPGAASALNLGMWQAAQWTPQMAAGFMQAAAVAQHHHQQQQQQQQHHHKQLQQHYQQQQQLMQQPIPLTSPPPSGPSSTPSSSSGGSPSPDIRTKSFARFNPYQVPHHPAPPRGSPQ